MWRCINNQSKCHHNSRWCGIRIRFRFAARNLPGSCAPAPPGQTVRMRLWPLSDSGYSMAPSRDATEGWGRPFLATGGPESDMRDVAAQSFSERSCPVCKTVETPASTRSTSGADVRGQPLLQHDLALRVDSLAYDAYSTVFRVFAPRAAIPCEGKSPGPHCKHRRRRRSRVPARHIYGERAIGNNSPSRRRRRVVIMRSTLQRPAPTASAAWPGQKAEERATSLAFADVGKG